MTQKQSEYLQHVTGLRGLAIIMVVLFHLSPQLFPNCFYGVDIFLVITGFLLFRGGKDRNDNFSFCTFLKKKVIRIYPLLSVLIIFAGISTLPFMYATTDAVTFGKNALSTFFGFSNYRYIKIYSDYFATASNMNPLLHTWYLSVTIQVYVLWALGRVLLQRAPSRLRLVCVYLIIFSSLLYCYSHSIQQIILSWGYSGWDQKSAVSYYDTMGRIWQVMAGGAVMLLPNFRHRFIKISLLLTGLTILCYFAFCSHELPVWSSLLVVIGTVLTLRYGNDFYCHKLMENKHLQKIGKISFSLYLIHFPILVFFRQWERTEPNLFQGIILLVITLVCAEIMWKMIEIRKFSLLKGGMLVLLSFIISIFARGTNRLGLLWDKRSISYPVYNLSEEHTYYSKDILNGFNEQIIKGDKGTQRLLKDTNLSNVVPLLSLSGMNEKPQFVLVGNSVAQQFYAGFHEICKDRQIPGIHLTSIVYPLWNYHVWLDESYNWTAQKANAFTEWLRCHPEIHTVVVSFLWKSKMNSTATEYTNWDGKHMHNSHEAKLELAKEFCLQMIGAGKHVVFITPSPVFMDFENEAYLGKGEDYVLWRNMRNKDINPHIGEDPFVITKEEYMNFNAESIALLEELEREGYCKLLRIEQSIFRDGNFAGLKGDTLFCRDKTHVTPAAAIYIIQGVADEFEAIMRENKTTPASYPPK